MPFEYSESESELVAGIIVEFSSYFFIVYSLLEINHIIFGNFIIVFFIIGGLYINIKFFLLLLILFLIPRCLAARIKFNHTLYFIIFYIFFINLFNLS